MNFKGNAFSLGEGSFVSGVCKDGVCRIFLKRGGAIAQREFNAAAKSIRVVDSAASYADLCWLAGDGIIEYEGGELTYEERS